MVDTYTVLFDDGTTTTFDVTNGEKGDKGDDGEPGATGNGIASVEKTGTSGLVDTYTITFTDGTTTTFTVTNGSDSTGDMSKAVYDTDNDGIVDNAEKVNNHTVETDVPANAVFTDTTYTAGTNISISSSNEISATDTTYTAGEGIDITNNIISNTQTSAEWGNIEGILSDQTDLQEALDNINGIQTLTGTEQTPININTIDAGVYIVKGYVTYGNTTTNLATFYPNGKIYYVSPYSGSYRMFTEISPDKTNTSYIVEGRKITRVSGSNYSISNPINFITTDYHDSTKQDKLVSGTNIKTINNESLLGSGNISISGGEATDVRVNGTSITSSGVANLVTNTAYNASSNKLATMSDVPDVSNFVEAQVEAVDSETNKTYTGNIENNGTHLLMETHGETIEDPHSYIESSKDLVELLYSDSENTQILKMSDDGYKYEIEAIDSQAYDYGNTTTVEADETKISLSHAEKDPQTNNLVTTGSVTVDSYGTTILGVVSPSSSTMAANKEYVDDSTEQIRYLPVNGTMYGRQLVLPTEDGSWKSLCTSMSQAINKTLTDATYVPGQIGYYSGDTTITSFSVSVKIFGLIPDVSYIFNTTSLTGGKPVYLKGTIVTTAGNTKGSFKPASTWWTQTLPDTADGYVYMYLGQMLTNTRLYLYPYHPIYEYKNGELRMYQQDSPTATTSAYGTTMLSDSVSSSSTDLAATPNAVKQAYDLAYGKQDALVSGTNIKTINSQSLLGSGNINISTGGTATDVQVNGSSITSNGVANIVTETAYNASTNKIATKSDIPDVSSFITKNVNDLTYYYTKTEVDGKVSAVYKYKGTVSTYANLPSSGQVIGDVYNVEQADTTHGIKAGDNVAWTGTDWDILGGEIDLSGYQTKIDSSNKLSSDLVDDTNKTNKFVTSTDKSNWNAKYDKPSGGIPSADLSSAVQTSLGKADTALQSEQYTGTITGITMNGASKGTSGVVDLGTVITDVSGKQDKIDSSHKLSADLISDGTTNKTVTSTEKSTWNGKQNTLVSGTNIKTINSTSLLGSGDIVVGGEANVQSDWNETNTSSDAYIKNKPTIPSVGNAKSYYGTSTTSATTQRKSVTSSGFTLETGATIFVKFSNANTYNGTIKLNVNSTGDKNVCSVGTTTTTRYYWNAGEVVGFVYDGTNFVMIEKSPATTTYYGITKLSSSVSSTDETLAATPNAVKQAYDLASGKQDALAVGTINLFAGTTAPTGWLICDGSAISRTTYSGLFTAIGTAFGSGNGSTTFNLPNLKGRIPVGLDSSDTSFDSLGKTGGSKFLQQHKHSGNPGYGNVYYANGGLSKWLPNYGSSDYPIETGNVSTEVETGDSGNLQPYVVLNYIIKY